MQDTLILEGHLKYLFTNLGIIRHYQKQNIKQKGLITISKKKRPEYVKNVCQRTLDRIEEELIKPEQKLSLEDIKNGNCDVTKDFLLEIKDEIKDMMLILDKKKYQPSYIYPLIENFRKKTELSELLKETWRIYIENT